MSAWRWKKNNAYTDAMHYVAKKHTAKLFESKGSADPIYKALTQCLYSMVNLKDVDLFNTSSNDSFYHQYIEMPVIMCNNFDKFRSTKMTEPDELTVISKNFMLEVDYAYIDNENKKKNDYFLIDIVDFAKISEFIEVIESDLETAGSSHQYSE